jgi:dienelactone hydrolase
MHRIIVNSFAASLSGSLKTITVNSTRGRIVNVLIIAGLIVMAMASATGWAGTPWNLKKLSAPPQVFPAPGFSEPGVRAIFFEGVPWQGKATRVFAWYGAPAHSEGQKLPAIVLVVGGGGTALAEWVRFWNARGYAAIAIDTCGSVPIRATPTTWQRDPEGGPPGWDASFEQLDWPVKDQWPYHAIADIILADSLLRSFPEIDPNRIGIAGTSWGGYMTTIAASIDKRFRFAVPVYGCGFLGDDSAWVQKLKKLGPEKSHEWLSLWDPSVYLHRARMPFLWVDGTNDIFYPPDSLRKSYLLPRGPRSLSMRERMPHNHDASEKPEEIHAFADSIVNSGTPLATVRSVSTRGQDASVSYRSPTPIVRAELDYTVDSGVWPRREWKTVAAEVNLKKHKVVATVPKGSTAYYFNLVDQRGLMVSSVLQIP